MIAIPNAPALHAIVNAPPTDPPAAEHDDRAPDMATVPCPKCGAPVELVPISNICPKCKWVLFRRGLEG